MDLISILATVILVTTIGTMVIGLGAYAAFKIRDRRKPSAKREDDTMEGNTSRMPIFLTRYTPQTSPAPNPDAT